MRKTKRRRSEDKTNGWFLSSSSLILVTASLIMHHLGPDDAILGAISLYLDILNLFLQILAILSRNRD